jgi:ribonucleoside-diphosphate reductase alpha chain
LKANALYRDGSKLSQPLNSQMFAEPESSVSLDEETSTDSHLEKFLGPVRTHASEKDIELV